MPGYVGHSAILFCGLFGVGESFFVLRLSGGSSVGYEECLSYLSNVEVFTRAAYVRIWRCWWVVWRFGSAD